MSVELEAAELILALNSGYAELPEIVAWADNLIMQSDRPRIELIDLALVKSTHEAIILLKEISKNVNSWAALRLFFKRFTNIKTLSAKDASQLAGFLFNKSVYEEKCPDEFLVFHSHWDDIDLAVGGYKGTVDGAIEAFLSDLRTIASAIT